MKKILMTFLQVLLVTIEAATTSFNGSESNIWSNAANWSNGLPGTTDDVIIAANCNVDGNFSVTNLTINSGQVLTINPGYTLTVSATLTNNAGVSGLVLNSNATGTGMLMNNTEGVLATVKQYLIKDQWHYMGTPVFTNTGSNPDNYTDDTYTNYFGDVDDVFHNCYVAWSNESYAYGGLESGWYYLSAGDAMHVFQGYAVQYNVAGSDNDTTIVFTGTLNTGTIGTVWASENVGWNLTCNPYPVTIDWDAAGGKTLTNSNDAFYVWNPNLNGGSGGYGSYGSYVDGGSTNGQTQYIAPMQGFFFEVWATEAGLSINNNTKVAHQTTFNKSIVKSNQYGAQIRLAVTDNDINYDEMLLRVVNESTTNFDRKYDAGKLKAMKSKLPLLYSVAGEKEYSINSIPEINENTTLRLKVLIKTSGEHKLVLKELKGYNYPYPIVLFNENGNKLASFQNEDFSFYGEAGKTKEFYLRFSNEFKK